MTDSSRLAIVVGSSTEIKVTLEEKVTEECSAVRFERCQLEVSENGGGEELRTRGRRRSGRRCRLEKRAKDSVGESNMMCCY